MHARKKDAEEGAIKNSEKILKHDVKAQEVRIKNLNMVNKGNIVIEYGSRVCKK